MPSRANRHLSTQLSGIDLPGLFAFPRIGSPVSNGLGHQNHIMSPRAHRNAPEASYAEAGSRHNPARLLRPYPSEAIEVAIPEVPCGRIRVNPSFDTRFPFLKGVKSFPPPGSRQSFLRPLKDTMWLLDHGPLIFLSGP